MPPSTIDTDASGERRPCIVFMPMLPGYEGIRATVARAIERTGFQLRRLETLLTDPEWQLWLVQSVPGAAFALVDVTDHNPFVMYELGLAHSRRLPAILFMNARNARVTATVMGSPFLPYEEDGLESAEDALVRWISLQDAVWRLPPASSRGEQAGDGYSASLALLEQFRVDSGLSVEPVGRDEYLTRWRVAGARGDRQPYPANLPWTALQELPRVIRNSDETEIMGPIVSWSLSRRPELVEVPNTST